MLMKMNIKIILYTLLLYISVISCNNKNSNTIHNTSKNSEIDFEPKINFKTVATLNETNKKILEIASIAFNNSSELKKSQLILKIKKDHQKIESDLQKISNQNLIIIPEPIFDLKLNEIFLKEENFNYYLISLLDKEIKNQIILLDSIENRTKDIEFKNFADKYKETLISNNAKLEEFL